jgi:hypothetical protein
MRTVETLTDKVNSPRGLKDTGLEVGLVGLNITEVVPDSFGKSLDIRLNMGALHISMCSELTELLGFPGV